MAINDVECCETFQTHEELLKVAVKAGKEQSGREIRLLFPGGGSRENHYRTGERAY